MSTQHETKTADKTKLSDLTVGDFRALIRTEMSDLVRDTVHEVLEEIRSGADPDEGLEFEPEIAERLEAYLRDKPSGQLAEEVMKELGLLDE